MARGKAERALRLAGAAAARREDAGHRLQDSRQGQRARWPAPTHRAIDPAVATAAWAAGRRLLPSDAIVEALEGALPSPDPRPRVVADATAGPAVTRATHGAAELGPLAELTAREGEVLRLVAQGLSDAQVAERLVFSMCTVNSHLHAVYGKLGVSSRAAATRFAVEHHLV